MQDTLGPLIFNKKLIDFFRKVVLTYKINANPLRPRRVSFVDRFIFTCLVHYIGSIEVLLY